MIMQLYAISLTYWRGGGHFFSRLYGLNKEAGLCADMQVDS